MKNRTAVTPNIGLRSILRSNEETLSPVSYIRVKYFQYGVTYDWPDTISISSASKKGLPAKLLFPPENELITNINCPIRILMEYVRNNAKIPETVKFDLFDEVGNLKHAFEVPPDIMASHILAPKAVYFIVVIQRSDMGSLLKPQILINRGARINQDYVTRIRRQLYSGPRKRVSAKV